MIKMLWVPIGLIIFGVICIIGGFKHTKDKHKKTDFSRDPAAGATSFEEATVHYAVGKTFNFLPWWVVNVFLILMGILLIVAGVLLIIHLDEL